MSFGTRPARFLGSDLNRHSLASINARHRVVRFDGVTLGSKSTREGAEVLCSVVCQGQVRGYAVVVTRQVSDIANDSARRSISS
jgi:hypothetical protein